MDFWLAQRQVEIGNKGSYKKSGQGIFFFFQKKDFFVLRQEEKGILFLSSYGAIHTITYVAAGRRNDSGRGHLVAWTEDMTYNIEKSIKWLGK